MTNISQLEREIREMGYRRHDVDYSTVESGAKLPKSLKGKIINHAIITGEKIEKVNFDRAAATGSIFTESQFINCKMDQPDFEFCNFKECQFRDNKKVIASFNNSDFIKCIFIDTIFESCTFTGVYFEECEFHNIIFKESTFENALFHNCKFFETNLTGANMEYIQIQNPTMNRCILSFSQVPYMFGCMQYLMNTNQDVRISSSTDSISVQQYFSEAMPKMVEYWKSKQMSCPEFNFPLANYYLSTNQYQNAVDCLKNGLSASIAAQDYRLIKYYCKLIADNNTFDYLTINKFYDIINRLAPKGNLNTPQMRSFMRNIGEIKATLFNSAKMSTLFLKLRTNLRTTDAQKLGPVISQLFDVLKMQHCRSANQVEVMLTENSPIIISLKICGTENNILFLLPRLLKMSGVSLNDCPALAHLENRYITDSNTANTDDNVDEKILNLSLLCQQLAISIVFSEYYIENCEKCVELGISPFLYANHEYKQIGVL